MERVRRDINETLRTGLKAANDANVFERNVARGSLLHDTVRRRVAVPGISAPLLWWPLTRVSGRGIRGQSSTKIGMCIRRKWFHQTILSVIRVFLPRYRNWAVTQLEGAAKRTEAVLWMTTEQALGACAHGADAAHFWAHLQPSTLVHHEVLRIQGVQLGCQVKAYSGPEVVCRQCLGNGGVEDGS